MTSLYLAIALTLAILRGHQTYPDDSLPVVTQTKPVAAA